MKDQSKPDAKTTASVAQSEPRKSSKDELSDQELDKAAGGTFSIPFTEIKVDYKKQD